MKIVYLIREESTKDRVRFYKFVNYFLRFENLIVLKKSSDRKEELNYQFHDICKSHKLKLIEYFYWIIGCLYKLRLYKKNYIFFCTGIDSVLPVFLFSIFYKINYVYDCPDNFHQSKKTNKYIKFLIKIFDQKIIENSQFTIFPDEIRYKDYNVDKKKLKVLRNFPSKGMLEESKSIYLNRKFKYNSRNLIIYINGWLVENRGLKMIKSFIQNSKNLSYIIIYSGIINPFENIQSDKLYYLGHLDSTESLSYYFNADIVFTFYNPEIEINKYATPNKWGDCLATSTIPVINSEILTVNNYFNNDSFFSVSYGDYNSLTKLISDIINDKELINKKLKNINFSNYKTWDNELDLIFEKHYD